MKHYNSSLWKVVAWCGLYVSWRNWFFTLVFPAIPNQRIAGGFMIGTHGRFGILVWNKWFFNPEWFHKKQLIK